MLVGTYSLPSKALLHRYAALSSKLYLIVLAVVDICSLLKQFSMDAMAVYLAKKVR